MIEMELAPEDTQDLIVVKYGSRALTGDPASLDALESNIIKFCKDIAHQRCRVIVVSSGAVFCGRMLAPSVSSQSVLSTIGNALLFRVWQKAFSSFGVTSSQILVTHRELEIESEKARLSLVLRESLNSGVIPIINENDALSDQELKRLAYGGDNDGLATEIAELVGARHLILFTDVEGFTVEGELQRELSLVQVSDLANHAGGSDRGGGMTTKLNAAKKFVESESGRVAHIARAGEPLGKVLSSGTGTTLS